VAALPVIRQTGEGPHIEERYVLDERGIVLVVIRNKDAGYERTYRLGAAT
jgi:hypothetical protein